MSTHFSIRLTIALIFGSFIVGPTILANDKPQQFQSDNANLALLGIWSFSNTNSTFVSIGLKNTGTAPLRAFRATVLKRNDFDEKEEVLALEFSSESEYLNKKMVSAHPVKPGEVIFFNELIVVNERTKTFYSSVPYIPPVMHAKSSHEAEQILREVGTDKRFLLQVGVLKQDPGAANDNGGRPVGAERNEETPQHPDVASHDSTSQTRASVATAETGASMTSKLCTIVGLAADDYLNVRSAPAMNSNTVLRISNGEKVQIRGDSVFNGDTEWVPVTIGNQQGWIRSKYLRPESH